MTCIVLTFFFSGYGVHRDLPVLSHSIPTRRSSGLQGRCEHRRQPRRDRGLPHPVPRADHVDFQDRLAAEELELAKPPPSHGRNNRPLRSTSTWRSEEHTSELQSLMRNSDAVFCWKKIPNEHTIRTFITASLE